MEEFSGLCNRTQKKCTEYLAPVFHLEEGPPNQTKWACQARCTQGSIPGPTYQLSRGRQAQGSAIWARPTPWVARPPSGPNRPIFLLQIPTAPLHLFQTCIVPPRKSNRGSTFGEAT